MSVAYLTDAERGHLGAFLDLMVPMMARADGVGIRPAALAMRNLQAWLPVQLPVTEEVVVWLRLAVEPMDDALWMALGMMVRVRGGVVDPALRPALEGLLSRVRVAVQA